LHWKEGLDEKKFQFFCFSGVDVMITMFCDIRQFFGLKMPFFSLTNVMLKFLQN
jgi:hypothetical protein